MYLRLRIRPNEPLAAPASQGPIYKIRPASFGLSLGLHLFVVAILFSSPSRVRSEETTLYRDIIQPQVHKIIYYNLQKKLPEVHAAEKSKGLSRPKGSELSRRTMIASSPNPKSNQQFIWQPAPKIDLPHDLALPNLIARAATALPPPPAELKKKPEPPNPSPAVEKNGDTHHARPEQAPVPQAARKAFVPPPQTPPATKPVQVAMLDAPELSLPSKTSSNALAALKLRRAFVPPPPQARDVRTDGSGLMAAPAANLAATTSRGVHTSLPEGLGAPSPGAGLAPPPPNSIPGTAANSGNASADLAIVGLHPTGTLGPLPDGARAGRFAKAPELGDPAGGGTGEGALTVPDLTIHEAKNAPASAPVAKVSRHAVLYSETVRSIPISTLSVPLRPSSRTIPAAIDARFNGRSVYTMVVPIENLPAYGGDWILWFAEREQKPGDAPSMRAPVPFRKLEPVSAILDEHHVERRVQIAAVIKRDGTLDKVSLVKGAPPVVARAVTQDLESWEFKPAMRDGAAVDVDVVMEIPFNLPVELASAGGK